MEEGRPLAVPFGLECPWFVEVLTDLVVAGTTSALAIVPVDVVAGHNVCRSLLFGMDHVLNRPHGVVV